MASTSLVDFHCHLDLYPDHAGAIEACERDEIYTLTVTTTPRAWPRNEELTSKTKFVRAALGLHPQLVADHGHEISLWEELLPRTRYVGEVGLDAGPRFYKSFDQQKRVFERILRACSEAGDKILTVHSVRAAKAVLDMIEVHLESGRGRIVLHWFTGTPAEVRRAIDLGCYFSVNHAMLDTEKRRALIARVPLERLLTETDGPFTTTGDRPSRPADVIDAVISLAALLGTTPMEMARQVGENLRQLLR